MLRFPTLSQYTTVPHPCQGIVIRLLGGYEGVIHFPPHTSPAGTLRNRMERERRASNRPAAAAAPLSHVRASQTGTHAARPCPHVAGGRDLDRGGRQPCAPGPAPCGRYCSKPVRAPACHLQRRSLPTELVRKRLGHTFIRCRLSIIGPSNENAVGGVLSTEYRKTILNPPAGC
jgi:hypothetical protein